jgi:hypothetical protein
VALREVWKHEAQDFTQWLQNNIDILNESLDLNLTGAERERPAGDFSVDLVAEDEDGGTVVIENQLEKSNRGGNSGPDGTLPVTSLNRNPERSAEQHTPHSFVRS